jgi:hypothetical protein
LASRHYVIERCLTDTELNRAVLTEELVAGQDIRAAERRSFETNVNVFEEPDNGWGTNDERNGADVVVVLLYHLDFTGKKHSHGPLPANHPEGLESGI